MKAFLLAFALAAPLARPAAAGPHAARPPAGAPHAPAPATAPTGSAVEDLGFQDHLTYSNQAVVVHGVAGSAAALTCSRGRKLDWAAYSFHDPTAGAGYTDADRWRCVELASAHAAPPPAFLSKKGGPVPGRAETGLFSNLDRATHDRFHKLLDKRMENGFAWKVSDRSVMVFYISEDRQSPAPDGRPRWQFVLNQQTNAGKSVFPIQVWKRNLPTEPTLRLFHLEPDVDLFLVTATNDRDETSHHLWTLDRRAGELYREIRQDHAVGPVFAKHEYLLHRGWLWERAEKRSPGRPEGRLVHRYWAKGHWHDWHEGQPGPQPPPAPQPAASH
jgi:hypothetical protein